MEVSVVNEDVPIEQPKKAVVRQEIVHKSIEMAKNTTEDDKQLETNEKKEERINVSENSKSKDEVWHGNSEKLKNSNKNVSQIEEQEIENVIYPVATIIHNKEDKQLKWRFQNCGYDSLSIEEFEEHIHTNHYKGPTFWNNIHPRHSVLENSVADKIASETVYGCLDCVFDCKTEQLLIEHVNSQHSFRCAECNFMSKNK